MIVCLLFVCVFVGEGCLDLLLARMRVCVCTSVCMYVCLYVCLFECVYVGVCVCMYVRMHV